MQATQARIVSVAQTTGSDMTGQSVAHERDAGARVLRAVIWTFAGATVVAAGILMWASQGETVFASLVSAAIAWCF